MRLTQHSIKRTTLATEAALFPCCHCETSFFSLSPQHGSPNTSTPPSVVQVTCVNGHDNTKKTNAHSLGRVAHQRFRRAHQRLTHSQTTSIFHASQSIKRSWMAACYTTSQCDETNQYSTPSPTRLPLAIGCSARCSKSVTQPQFKQQHRRPRTLI